MATTYLVDGYNLMHRSYREFLSNASLEEARDRLIAELTRFQHHAGGTHVILVFDGRSGMPGARVGKTAFQVLFSRGPQTADDVILDLCRKMEGRGGRVVVVTSDLQDIGFRISGLSCEHQTSEEFARDVGRVAETSARGGGRRAPTSGEAEKPTRSSQKETDEWLREFGLHPDEDS
ncbi:MAG: NYN domain-containing protein [Planctomycetota bacterium]